MREQESLDIARRLWDAIALGDAEALHALLSEKCTWHMPGDSAVSGSHEGPDAILRFMARVGELTDELRSDLIDLFVAGEETVLRYSVHAERGRATLDTEHLFRIRTQDGRICEGFFTPVDQAAYDAFFGSG